MPNWFRPAAALVALASLAPAAAAQEAPSPTAQRARWHLDGATSRCVLTRRIDGSPAPATFILRTIPGSRRYELILAGRELPAELRRVGSTMRLLLSPGGNSYEGEARTIDLPGELDRGVALGPLPGAFLGELAGSSALRLSAGAGAELGSWRLPAAARAAEAFAACEAAKQIEWGADPASVGMGASRPRRAGDASSWVTPRDLGLSNALAAAAFTAVFRLVVEPDGRASSCTLLESVTNIAHPGDVCRTLVRRARYEPARDARGTPVRAVAIHLVSVRTHVEFRVIGGG